MKKILIVIVFVLLSANQIIAFELPKMEPYVLQATHTFADSIINESSALVKSRVFPGVFWTLNDSGDDARIFPVTKEGKMIEPSWYDDYSGLYLVDAHNIDWEDITTDNNGNLIIGACGNNGNTRRDLAVYILTETHPQGAFQTRIKKQINFYYPEQTEFPPEKNNFDCEAIFTAENEIYFLTKHRADKNTVLYKLEEYDVLKNNPLKKLAEFPIHGNVTAADCSIDNRKLAVLTYENIWIFESDDIGNWFKGKKLWMPISAKQCEAIAFDGDDLIITNEQMEIIEVPMDKFIEIK